WRTGDTHVLMLTAHRVACDARSLDLLLAGGTDPSDIDYPDFAAHQRNQLDAGALDDDIAYWRDRLDGATALELGLDRPRPAVPSLAARRVTAAVDPDTITRLRKADPNVQPVLLAGVHAVLARYTRQDDIVVGTVVNGRDLPEYRTMIGPCADTLPLRTDVAGDPTFAELTDRVEVALRGVAAHRRVPFATLVDRLAPPHDASRHPYFQVVCHIVDDPVDPQRIPVPTDLLRHDLAITVDLSDVDTPTLIADYATDLFDEWRILALLRHIRNVLTAVADDTAIPVSALPLLDADESLALSEFGRGPVRPYHRGPVHQLIFDRVRRHPDTLAAVFAGTSMTYRELGRRAGVLATRLRALGVGRDDVVGVALPRGLDAPAAIVGVLAAGATFLPVDPTHPRERIGFVFADSGISALVTVSEIAVPAPDCPVIMLDELWCDDTEPEPLTELATPDSGAYLLYTSGSTGRPKGVLVEHHAVACYLDFFGVAFELGVGDRVLQFSPLIFDVGVGELLATLAYGATVVPVPHHDMIDPAGLAALLRREKVSRAGLTPSVLTRVPTGDYPDLTHLMVAGEACGPELVNTWQAPGRMFMNLYGPTEAAVGCTYEICAHRHWPAPPPIGGPMANRRIYLVDRYGNPVPRGVAGELLVAGDGLARGYHNRPELTETQFVPDPFEPHGRAYRSGDLAAWTETGRIQFLGRIDAQVKLHGQRIELEEIETVLARHPQVRQAVVTLRHDTPSGDGLVAYILCHDPENPPAAAELRTHLAGFLPSIMIPAGYLTLPALPLGATGKANRSALPPAPPESFATTTFTAPRTDTEHQVAAIYTDVLGRPKIGATDDFFALGGSSLQVVLVLNRIDDRFGVQLPTQAFYTDPAVHAVARAIEDTVLNLVSDDEIAALLAQSPVEEESDGGRVDP
ncbi:MAG TPA: amino acid adenylation domain-containing protein, partial [Pseudonocardiaceae bacterium]|nr:amino acid adenylation domain-containing protein [Pseudonocardiaceae bacterium]